MRGLPNTSTHGRQHDLNSSHPPKYLPGSVLLNFSDLMGTGLLLGHALVEVLAKPQLESTKSLPPLITMMQPLNITARSSVQVLSISEY